MWLGGVTLSVLVVVGKNITFKKLSKGKWIIFGSLIAWGENAWGNSLTEPTYDYIYTVMVFVDAQHNICTIRLVETGMQTMCM